MPELPLAVQGSGVTMIYGDRVAFRASDVAVPSGMITNVIGPNGSGKSTLLNAIAGLTPLEDFPRVASHESQRPPPGDGG